jgi:ATP-binding cassette subfamily B protein
MHKGHVREVGTHQQLLAQRGIYFKLYQLQYKDQEVAIARAPSSPGAGAMEPEVTARGDD